MDFESLDLEMRIAYLVTNSEDPAFIVAEIMKEVEKAEAVARLSERERCAMVCERVADKHRRDGLAGWQAIVCAAEVRK